MACFTFLSACTITLAPSYDADLYRGINTLNSQVLALFVSVPAGGDSCDAHTATYDKVIGLSEALAMQSRARPMPDNKIINKLTELLKDSEQDFDLSDEPPSAGSLDEIQKVLTKMKIDHCDDGKVGIIAKQTYKVAIVTSMDQAITYEAFLNRASGE